MSIMSRVSGEDSFATTVAYAVRIHNTTACGGGYTLTPLPRLKKPQFSLLRLQQSATYLIR
jgi:hypothetical protein